MATYYVEMTRKACRYYTKICKPLVEMHRNFDPSIPPSTIKVISSYITMSHGNYIYVGGSGATSDDLRWMRVTIEVPAGSKAAIEKDDLMRRVVQCCMDHQGKKAMECEIEVRVIEIDQNNMMRVAPMYGRQR